MNVKIFLLISAWVIVGFAILPNPNPFFGEYETPFGAPPFDLIQNEHFMPAFLEGIKQEQAEVDAIANNPKKPTFENTLAALDGAGSLLTKVSNVFFNLNSANTNDSLQAIAKRIAPLLSKENDDILLNEKLFQRIKTVYDQKDQLKLNQEEKKLLEDVYRNFVKGGANLSEKEKDQLRAINQELSVLSVQFGENVLAEVNAFEMVIDKKADLAGLNQGQLEAAAEAAKDRGLEGKWVFTIHKPSLIPFLQYSEKRELRKKMFMAYANQGNNDNKFNNNDILARIASLRVRKAKLLGYNTWADFILDENMAKKPENVYKLLDQLWKPALAMAKKEAYDLQAMIYKEGHNFRLEAWDWWYYSEKVKKEKYAFDDQALRPYFELNNVRKGVFEVANKLWGITFEERTDIPKLHPDVTVFEVKDKDGSHIGVYFTDYFPRASKRGGAWMSSFRKQFKQNGKNVTPVITNVGNFSKPTADKPALLSVDEAKTLFHEFGHALHGLLSNCTYQQLSGTAVARDFVEMPSQVMENWALEPEVLKLYARHYKTGEVIPNELIEKVKKAATFNQGFETVEYLAASYLDMDWHTLSDPKEVNPAEFEAASMKRIGLIPEIIVRYRSPYFRHIFAGGYSSGYYSYIWAEVLDADAFQAFKETSLFDKKTASSFRENILAAGGTDEAMTLYKKFRGKEPEIEPLLVRRGLK